MKPTSQKIHHARALHTAILAAKRVGILMRKELRASKKANSITQHDIKLELDVFSQKLIEQTLAKSFPSIAVLGEEGITGDIDMPARWVVDPIDGTVNFAYGIPHACVSIALQEKLPNGAFRTVVGVVYDPFANELFTAIVGEQAKLNGQPIHVSDRRVLKEAIVALGFSKSKEVLDKMLPGFNQLVYRIRKVRILGAAALSLAWVAAGRMDAYLEAGVRLWDIAAGGLILECAGGEFWNQQIPGYHYYRMVANNGHLRKKIVKHLPV